MLEGLVAGLLNRFLGMYVKNFDPTQLKVGIWSGDVKLHNLELRKEALDQLKLPINVLEGHLGQLTLTIPWNALRTSAVKIYIEDVFLLASPREEAVYNEEEEAARRQRLKMEKLESAELLKERSQEGLSQEEQRKSQSLFQSMTTKIVDNLQVTIKNIHVRYEDSISAPGHPFALGVTLKEFSAISTDGQWKPSYITDVKQTAHKLVTLGALAVYWDTDTELLGSGREVVVEGAKQMPHDELIEKFKGMIGKGDDAASTSHQFMLRPVSGEAKVVMDKSGSLKVPKFKATLLFEEIGIVLDDDQYRDALMMVDLFHYFIRHQEYKKLQPKGVSPKEDPRAWFIFGINAVKQKIHERKREWSWDYFRERRDDRVRYIELFKKKKQSQEVTPDESKALAKLEEKLSYEDLRFWRSLARNQLRKENAESARKEPPKPAQQPQQQGWLAWAWGSKPQEQSQQGKIEDAGENITMTEEQRKELYDAIEWNEKTALAEAVDVPKDSVKLQLDVSLGTGSFTLKKDPHDTASDLLSLHFDLFKAKFLQRPTSYLADISLGGLRVNDGTTPDSLFQEIVRVKDAPNQAKKQRLSIQDLEQDDEEPFFQLEIEKNPIDRAGDIALVGKLKPLEVVWNPNFVVGVADFFRPPERHMESITALMESAGATVDTIREQTRAGLEFALEEHRTLNAKLELQAPLIIVPLSIKTKESTCLIVDAGHISVNSELVDEMTKNEIQAKQRQVYTEEDQKRLESLCYDKFLVKLSSTQVLIGPSIEATKAQLEERDEEQMLHVVDRINVDLTVAMSILPKAPNLTKIKVSGNLPVLHVAISDTKYKNLMKIIDVAIPKFGSPKPPTSGDGLKPRPQLTATPSNKISDRRQSTQFPFMTQETAIVLDDDDDDKSKYVDAPEGNASEQLRMQQRSFELKFTVDTLKGTLYRSNQGAVDTRLVELVANNFDLEFYLRPYDMAAEVYLNSVRVDDFISEDLKPEFKSVITSGDVEDQKQNRKLVYVKFVRVNKESPEFMPKYEGVDMNVTAQVSTINLIVTRRTLLTLLDFILITFTNTASNVQQPPKSVTDSENDVAATVDRLQDNAPAQSPTIKVKVDLKSVRLILNDDGIRLATLSLNHADVGVFLQNKTMRVLTKLGNLSLVDDVNQGGTKDSSIHQLITIQGDELADFQYETFDSTSPETYPGYDSSIFLRAGSIKVNFLEEPFRKIVEFAVGFGRMQTAFNSARQAAVTQASQIQQNSSRMKFDIIIRTPIVVFPRVMQVDRAKRDVITAYLGEIYAQNKFAPIDDAEDSQIANKLSTGIRKIRLTSDFHYEDDVSEELEMIDHVDLGLNMTYAEHKDGARRPDMEIEGSMSALNLKLTQYQMQFLMEISKSVPAAFVVDSNQVDAAVEQEVDDNTMAQAKRVQSEDSSKDGDQLIDLGPELGHKEKTWTVLDVDFQVETIGLELIMAPKDKPVGTSNSSSLSRFALDKNKLKLRTLNDGSLESEFVIQSFTIIDSRPQDNNKYRHIMLSDNKNAQQLMASVTMTKGEEPGLIAIVTIDSPKVHFALDYVFALQHFVTAGLETAEPLDATDGTLSEIPEESDAEADASSLMVHHGVPKSRTTEESAARQGPGSKAAQPAASVAFRVNIVDAQVILIANPLVTNSEAIVLGIKQVLLSKQHATTLQVSELGMFLCRMDKFEQSRLRIIDDFSIQLSLDESRENRTSIHLDIEPLIMRLSLQDVLLATAIVSKASELSSQEEKKIAGPSSDDRRAKELQRAGLKQRTPSGKAISTIGRSRAVSNTNTAGKTTGRAGQNLQGIVEKPRHEDMTATIDGIRVVLLGDLHELPIFDLGIKNFTVNAEDWSSKLKAETAVDLYMNVYSFAKSAWEPLLEPWQFGIGIAKEPSSGLMSIDVASKKTFDVTLTTATIGLVSKSLDFLAADQDVLGKPRGIEAPYKIRNYTGFDVTIRAKTRNSEETQAVSLEDGTEAPWSFEPWEKMRENLTVESNANNISVTLEGSGFNSVGKIRLHREGEFLFALEPKADDTQHRLMVEVTLGKDNVKYVTLRSPLLVENHTQIPVELGVYDAQEGNLLKIEKIAPGESRPAPVGAVYLKSLLIRPDSGFGYAWSSETLWWRDLLKRPKRTIVCKGENGDPFYFQLNATVDKSRPLANHYPYMRIKLSPPVVLENLLPYDFKYRIYDKTTSRDWANFLRKGGVSPVHVVELSHLLMLSIDMQDTVFEPSDFAIINPGGSDEFKKEKSLVCKDKDGLSLKLKLQYHLAPDCGGAFKVTIYSPYVILNKTGLDISIRGKAFMQSARDSAGQASLVDAGDDERPKATPFMFSYGHEDHRNRALIRVADSEWSKPQSFDAIGSSSEVILQSTTRKAEVHVGLSVESGEGKYSVIKVVTISPRFIVKNKMGEDINIREMGSSKFLTLKHGGLQALHFMQQRSVKQLCLCYPGADNQWSSPFNISDIGTTHIKMARAGQRQQLVRAEILVEDGSIFVHLSAENTWPYYMRNASDTEFIFYQANPASIDDDIEDRSGWRQIRYRLPPRSEMPYAWDFPAAKHREIVIKATQSKERSVKLAEIGTQVPLRLVTGPGEQKYIDINVTAEGPRQMLVLANYKQSKSLYRQKSRSGNSSGGFEVKEQDTGITFRAQLKLSGIGISLINAKLNELAYVTLRDVHLQYSDSNLFQTVSLAVKWIQIDNQLFGGIFPMILYPSVVPKRAQEIDAHPSLHAMVTRVKNESYGVQYIKYATILLQEMTVEIDEDFMWAVVDFVGSIQGGGPEANDDAAKLCEEDLDIPEPKQEQAGQDFYFEVLNIQPMQLNISVMRTEQVNADERFPSKNPISLLFNVITMAIGNINDAPVRLNALVLENARVSLPLLVHKMSNHYQQAAMFQLHKIVGSADFLGNPVGLFNSISSGITDVFYEPYQGLILSDRPEEFGLGIAKGAASFVKKSVYGFSDSFSKWTGSVSKGLAAATMDKQFQDRRRMTRSRNRPKHALYGVTIGANSLFSSVASGVGGLARKPLEGAEQEGAFGFFKGVGKGVLGLATKPAVGVFDLASNVSEGIRNTTTVFDGSELDRVRLTRFVPKDGIVRPYNAREALGQSWLKQVDNGRYFNEKYIAHLELPREDMVVIVTYARILLIRSRRLTSEWDVPLKDVHTITKERTGMSLTLKGGTNGPFIPVGDEGQRAFLYRMVQIAVEDFNLHFKAKG